MTKDFYINFIPSKELPINKSDESLWFVFIENEMLIIKDSDNLLIPTYKDLKNYIKLLDNYHYIGDYQKQNCYCLEIPKNLFKGNFEFITLRKLQSIFNSSLFFVCGRAYQILHWQNNTKFCGRCGCELIIDTHKISKDCTKCQLTHYPKITPAIAVAITKDNYILLAKNKNYPNNLYSVIFGFLEPCETLEDCVKREVLEETGIHIKNIRYFSNEPWPYPDTLMVAFFAEYDYGEINVDGKEIIAADWFCESNMPLIHEKNTLPRKMIDSFLANNFI